MDELISSIREIAHGDAIILIAFAAAIVIVTAVASHLATKIVKKAMQVDGLPIPSSSILVNVVRIVIWVVGISIMLSACFNVDVNALLAALGVGGVALSLGLQDTLKNFIGGLQVTLMGIAHPGDHIIVGGMEGIVRDVTWRQTTLINYEKSIVIIPNSIMGSATIEKVEPEALVSTRLAFANDGRDLTAMISEMELLAKQAIEEVAELEKDPWILLTEIGEYGTWAKMRFVLKDTKNAREARDAALRAVAPYARNNAIDVLHDDGVED